MNEPDLPDDSLDALLRAGTPRALPDDGFVARTMTAVDRATRARPVSRRPAPVAPIAIARALAAEQRRHEAQARLWRWAIAGLATGVVLLVAAVFLSPDDGLALATAAPRQWAPLCLMAAAGAIWVAWRELRSG
jgi:hypothetical protein